MARAAPYKQIDPPDSRQTLKESVWRDLSILRSSVSGQFVRTTGHMKWEVAGSKISGSKGSAGDHKKWKTTLSKEPKGGRVLKATKKRAARATKKK